MSDPKFIARSELKSRGWTDALIRDLLGAADKETKNPHYLSGPPMRLYSIVRVVDAEECDANKQRFLKAAERSNAARLRSLDVSASKRQALLDWIENLQIEVIQLDVTVLRNAAIQHYNELWAVGGKFEKHASFDSSEDFLSRVEYNFVRHALTNYDHTLEVLFNQTGKHEAYYALRKRVNTAIASAYPQLNWLNADSLVSDQLAV